MTQPVYRQVTFNKYLTQLVDKLLRVDPYGFPPIESATNLPGPLHIFHINNP